MDSGLSMGAPSSVTVNARTDIGIARPSSGTDVPTDLPAAQAVEAAGESQSTAADARRPLSVSPSLDDSALVVQKLSVDQETHVLVYSQVDSTTGYVVNQFPDKLVLRQKAYFRQMLDKMASSGSGSADKLA